MLNIVLVYHAARNDNLGVGALTEAEIEIIRTISRRTGIEVHITIVDGKSAMRRPAYVSGPDITVKEVRVLRHPMVFYRMARAADMVVDIGAGDSFTDIYGLRRIATLFVLKYLTHIARRPLVVAPQTVGPFEKALSRLLAVRSLKRSAIVSTRDAMSTACAQDMGLKNEIIEASDVALRLPYDPPQAKNPADAPKVGINVSGLLMRGGYTGKNMFGLNVDYRQLIYDILEHFLAHQDGCEVHLVPHVISWERGSVEDDVYACEELAERYPDVKLAPSFETPSEAKSYIAGLDFFMGARMHSCIAAFSSGVPVVPMAYSRKFAGLFGSLGYDYTVDCTSEEPEVILQAITKAYENRETLAKEMSSAFQRGLDKLNRYESALEQLVRDVSHNS